MTDSRTLSSLLTPLVTALRPASILVVGDTASAGLQTLKDTRIRRLATPRTPSQLAGLEPVDLAVVSDLDASLDKVAGQQWLGQLRNLYAPRILLVSDRQQAQRQGWQLCDFLAMGFRHVADSDDGLQLFSYAIDNYQPDHDWLNSRFWANPHNYGKYRW